MNHADEKPERRAKVVADLGFTEEDADDLCRVPLREAFHNAGPAVELPDVVARALVKSGSVKKAAEVIAEYPAVRHDRLRSFLTPREEQTTVTLPQLQSYFADLDVHSSLALDVWASLDSQCGSSDAHTCRAFAAFLCEFAPDRSTDAGPFARAALHLAAGSWRAGLAKLRSAARKEAPKKEKPSPMVDAAIFAQFFRDFEVEFPAAAQCFADLAGGPKVLVQDFATRVADFGTRSGVQSVLQPTRDGLQRLRREVLCLPSTASSPMSENAVDIQFTGDGQKNERLGTRRPSHPALGLAWRR